jgi:hypothetical protein
MTEFAQLFAVDSATALRFFYHHLADRHLPAGSIDEEHLYVASVLASYAQTSPGDLTCMPPLSDLAAFRRIFVERPQTLAAPGMIEDACAQLLFLNGFFRDQMRQHHDVHSYDKLASAFYAQASERARSERKKALYILMAEHFRLWALACWDLQRTLRNNHLLLRSA